MKKSFKSNEDREKEIKELSESIENGTKDVFKSDKYKKYLNTMAKFHNYSFRNLLLIFSQNPEATCVAGFTTWKNSFKRTVNKGEKGIKIFAPAPVKIKVEEHKKDNNGNYIYSNGKKVIEQVDKVIPKYKITHVFDVSQTSGEPIPSLVDELKGKVNDYDTFKRSLINVTDFEVVFKGLESERGYCSIKNKVIAINEGMSELQTIKTMIHEVAHSMLHSNTEEKTRSSVEIEAESVAYVVSSYYGLDVSEYSFNYLASWSKDKELTDLKSSLDIIQKGSSELIRKIDENYNELISNKDIKLNDKSFEDNSLKSRIEGMKEKSKELNIQDKDYDRINKKEVER